MVNSTKLASETMVSIPLTPTTLVPSMFIVTKNRPVGGGQCCTVDSDFYHGWDDYKRGFGNLNGEFWLGLDKIHRLTKERSRLHVDLEETTGKTAYAEYDFFGVASERSKYKLSLGTYSGNI